MNTHRLERLRTAMAPHRQKLVDHSVYTSVHSMDQLRVFMEHHVFAVWDFMSLLKSLQRELTCVDVPWMPKGNAATRYLINEIVTGEESDVDAHGNRVSHFELYVQAMQQAGCSLGAIQSFTQLLSKGFPVDQALQEQSIPSSVRQFVANTFRVIRSGKPHVMAAVFTFGREDLIPDMFLQLIGEMKRQFPNQVDIMQYYIERHIEVDGGHHGELALAMTHELCGDDEQKWQECEAEVITALVSRAALWDGIVENCTAAAAE